MYCFPVVIEYVFVVYPCPIILPVEECNSSHMPVIEFPDKSLDFTVIIAEVPPVGLGALAGPLGSNKKFIDTPLIEVVMVQLPNTWTPSTVVDAPVDVVLLGKGTPVGFPVDMEPVVVVTLVAAVTLVVVFDIVLELPSEVSSGEVRPVLRALAEEKFANGNNIAEKIITLRIERKFFFEFIYLT